MDEWQLEVPISSQWHDFYHLQKELSVEKKGSPNPRGMHSRLSSGTLIRLSPRPITNKEVLAVGLLQRIRVELE